MRDAMRRFLDGDMDCPDLLAATGLVDDADVDALCADVAPGGEAAAKAGKRLARARNIERVLADYAAGKLTLDTACRCADAVPWAFVDFLTLRGIPIPSADFCEKYARRPAPIPGSPVPPDAAVGKNGKAVHFLVQRMGIRSQPVLHALDSRQT
jgi:hypothetical protein